MIYCLDCDYAIKLVIKPARCPRCRSVFVSFIRNKLFAPLR